MADTVPGDSSTNAKLRVGNTVTGTINTSGDHDWYKVTLKAGQTYTFSTEQSGVATLDTTLTLRSASGTQLAFDDDGGDGLFSNLQFTATTGGVY